MTVPAPESPDPEALDSATYHGVVGPALQAAAEVAAERGDPTLHADMPSMLALIDLISALAARWRRERSVDQRTARMLEGAPAAACVMVLQEAKLDESAIGQCLAALEAAYAQLVEYEVTAAARTKIDNAWRALQNDRREVAVTNLKEAAQQIVTAIEDWQAKVH